ncbi:zinc-binding dehydrogenase [soil metagenome]
MRAARFEGNRKVVVGSAPDPVPGRGEVLVRVDTCALCGTDRPGYLAGSEVTPGHETSGTVVGVGDEVDDDLLGARGVVYLVAACGRCYACRRGSSNMCVYKQAMYGFTAPGGFAERVAVRADCFLPVEDGIPLDAATALLDLYGTARHALNRVGARRRDALAVIGCGPIGLGVVSVARALETADVLAVDIEPYRLELAERLGATPVDATAGDAVAAALAPRPDGYEVVVEAAGHPATQQQAIDMAAPGGRVAIVAHSRKPLPLDTLAGLIQKERSIVGSEYFRRDELGANQELMLQGRLDPRPAMTHTFGLDDMQAACDAFFSGATGKVLVRP